MEPSGRAIAIYINMYGVDPTSEKMTGAMAGAMRRTGLERNLMKVHLDLRSAMRFG